MGKNPVSRYGVYRDLNLSPYVYESPYGDSFKFPSQKKLDMYHRDITNEIERVSKTVSRLGLEDFVPFEIIQLLYRATYKALYRKIVR